MSAYRKNPVRSEPAEGPAIALDATDVHVGRVEVGDSIVCGFNVLNLGKEALTLSANPG
jgi:hypothetical protein